ncbi:MAG: DUF1848 domain-containing protein [Lachnospiraceae bacterium]|nr:DUF1848 domain-containing protein [Lachnospiraceae bacterium]
MILHTGNRTDIPAYYSKWFVNRLQEGVVCVRNPYNPTAITKYRLDPEVVDMIVFCTKNPAPLLPYMGILEPYGQYWYVTITPYEADIEPHVPDKSKVMEDFKELSGRLGVERVGWRYDPIFLSEKYALERHIRDFEAMASTLAGYTDTCVISFIDLYQKVVKNFPEVKEVGKEEKIALVKAFVEIGRKYGMTIKTCGEGDEWEQYGVDCSGCMTQEVYERALGCGIQVPKTKGARTDCGCILGGDIGAYNTCGHLCRYCYANYDEKTVKYNMRNHDPKSPLLIGNITADDVVHEAKQESWKDMQLRLW